MSLILQVFIALVLFISISSADELRKMDDNISLQKDEQKVFLVKYENKERKFKFRWTLYTNEGLVTLSSYDTIVSQHMMYLNNTHQTFRVILKRGSRIYERVYFLVKFKEFDSKKNRAIFELFLSDPKGITQIEEFKYD